MSDKNKPEDPIEKLFRQKAGEFDINFREEDWQKLEKRLDMADLQHDRIIRRRWLVAASVLLFSVLGYFTYDNYTSINKINEQLSNESTPEVQENIQRDNFPPQPEPEEESGEDDSNQELAEQELNNVIQDSEMPGQRVNTNSVKESGTGSSRMFVAENSNRDLYISEISCPTCTLSSLAVHEGRPGSSILPAAEPGTGDDLIASADQTQDGEERQSMNETNRILQSSKEPRFAVGLVLSPDLSTVGSVSNFSRMGYKAGITLEYKIVPALSVSTGILQSDVRYVAGGNEYNPPSGFYWSNGIIPDETVGRCLLIDIPVTLKYEFMHFSRSRIFATAGLSSYIMLNEDYRFNYGDYGDYEPGLVDGWSGNTGTSHWMSNAGFSVGYEFDLHRNWSLRAEPFIKIPLKEVGWGNVNLYSLGSFFSINYRL